MPRANFIAHMTHNHEVPPAKLALQMRADWARLAVVPGSDQDHAHERCPFTQGLGQGLGLSGACVRLGVVPGADQNRARGGHRVQASRLRGQSLGWS